MDENQDLHFYLVFINDSSSGTVLQTCAKAIRERMGSKTHLTHLDSEKCLQIDTEELRKTDIFIFPYFEGPSYEHIRSTKRALILGPQSLTHTLTNRVPIPNGPNCIYNAAMWGLVIAFSALKDPEKSNLVNYIELMGGICVNQLTQGCTHLVSNTVLSNKYEMAAINGIKIMKVDWVKEVWKRNKSEPVPATDSVFEEFKMPVFYNLNVTCTYLKPELKNKVEKLIKENGGSFHGTLKVNVVDVLILKENGKTSEKFKVASKYGTPCLAPEWVIDSVKLGYAVGFVDYLIAGEVRVSTPKKDDLGVPEFSVSRIQGICNTTANETVHSLRSNKNLSAVSTNNEDEVPESNYKDIIKGLTATQAKKAGLFLDGCNIFFSGFTNSELTKLNKIVSTSGAIRFDELNENVTHVVIGKRIESELQFFREVNNLVNFVKLDWLLESIKQKQAVNEEDFLYPVTVAVSNLPEPPSPASKKNIESMNSSFKKPLPFGDAPHNTQKNFNDKDNDVNHRRMPKENLMNRYLQSSASNMVPVAAKEQDQSKLMHSTFDSDIATEEYENLEFFLGKTFYIQCCPKEEEYLQMMQDIRNFEGRLVDKTFKGEVDYLVVPAVGLMNFKAEVKAKFIVSNLWMEDVITQREEVPVEYFHRAMTIQDDSILKDIHCTISTYGGTERLFLLTLCKSLGAIVEERYAKVSYPILICEVPDGNKYKGAINWEFPVVSKEWLLDCYMHNTLYRIQDYLVGESILCHERFIEINGRGLRRGEMPMFESQEVVIIQTQSPIRHGTGQPGPSGTTKRKSEELKEVDCLDDDDEVFILNDEKRFKSDRKSPTFTNRVLALRSESKSTSPLTPISKHIQEVDFGYDTPRRKMLYDVLKETADKTPQSPHTPAVMKMPSTPLHPDPEASPGSQWNVIHKFNGFLNKKPAPKLKKQTAGTPLSELKRRFWKEAIGEENYQSAIFSLNSQIPQQEKEPEQAPVPPENIENANTSNVQKEPEAVTALMNFINRRKSEPKPTMQNLETPDQYEGNQTVETGVMVGWEDPDNFKRSSQNEMIHKGIPYFLTSSVEGTCSIADEVKKLNGKIQEKLNNYDPMCTHVLCSKIGRMEKIMCALAAGKWILSINYIEDSVKANRFLNEELYQWGNAKAKSNLPPMGPTESAIATAACNWRIKIKEDDEFALGAFQGFKCLMLVKTAGFRKLIEAGGGVVFDSERPLSKNILAKTATHCFIDKKAMEKQDYDFCVAHKIPVYLVHYLNKYLLNERTDSLKDYEFKM